MLRKEGAEGPAEEGPVEEVCSTGGGGMLPGSCGRAAEGVVGVIDKWPLQRKGSRRSLASARCCTRHSQ